MYVKVGRDPFNPAPLRRTITDDTRQAIPRWSCSPEFSLGKVNIYLVYIHSTEYLARYYRHCRDVTT